jgi:hypothetical protein
MAEFIYGPDTFTEEEIRAARQTKKILRAKIDGDKLSDREIIVATMNCKLRSEIAARKYEKWLEELAQYDIHSVYDIYNGAQDKNSNEWVYLAPFFNNYAGCGRDKDDRAVVWIQSRFIPNGMERNAIRAALMYYTAIHSDLRTMRNGITFVVDTDGTLLPSSRESKLQKIWQTMPARPQQIFILGTSRLKQIFANSMMMMQSLFVSSEKMASRVQFGDIWDVEDAVPLDALPVYQGGNGGGLTSETALVDWIKSRIREFPAFPKLD